MRGIPALRGHGIAAVALHPRRQVVLAADQEPDVLGDVGGVVADALDVLGHEQQVGAAGDAARVFHHVGQQLAEQRGVGGVELGVAGADGLGGLDVVVAVGHQHVAQLLDGQPADHLQAAHLRQGWGEVERGRAFGDVGRVVADALDV